MIRYEEGEPGHVGRVEDDLRISMAVPGIIPEHLRSAAERARKAEHIAADVVESYLREHGEAVLIHDHLYAVALAAARAGLGFRD